MLCYSYFINNNLIRYDKPKGQGVTAVLKDKAKHKTLGYNLAKHSLITVLVTTSKPSPKHTHTHTHTTDS